MASNDDVAGVVSGEDPEVRKKRHGMLKMYYGLNEDSQGGATLDPCDINGAHFKPDVYLGKLIREKSLTELMDKESEMLRQIKSLDSDMQTLVYENYNKFISATDTIRKMKNDFKKMEDEMDHLATNMSAITEFSANISHTLQDGRQQITKLSGVHSLLKKLQFLFELPSRLKKCIEMKAYSQAVRYYTKAQRVLHQYQHMPSFQGINTDCDTIIAELCNKLREQFKDREFSESKGPDAILKMLERNMQFDKSLVTRKPVFGGFDQSNPKQLAECVDLLLQLDEPAEVLCEEFLSHARQKLGVDLDELERQIKLQQGEIVHRETDRPAQAYLNTPMITATDCWLRMWQIVKKDFIALCETECAQYLSLVMRKPVFGVSAQDVLEFVDSGCNGFLSNMCLVIASYNDMFLNRHQEVETLDAIALKKLVNFVNELMELYFSYVQQRVQLEKETGDNTILVRALDRFHRRLQAMNKLLPDTDFSRAGTDIVSKAARERVKHYLESLKQHFSDCLTDVRQNLAAPRLASKQDAAVNLSDLLSTTQTTCLDQIKSVLGNLQAFIASDITFAMKPYFRGTFCTLGVREGLVVAFLRHVNSVCQEFCEGTGERGSAPPALLLILSRLCSDFENATISYLLSLTEEQFDMDSRQEVTSVSSLCNDAKDTAQQLLNHYVKVQGLAISQMLRKSVETRDWLNTIEPRNVRAVMKRVVEDITAIDTQVGQLYEEGVRKERSSDSSRRAHSYSYAASQQKRGQWNFTPSIDNSLMSNIQKLFSEKIEIFSAVEFSKVSVLTGIIKISLKTFMECVRVRTFGRYGLQQIQVDTHYLQLYLWRFVSDENLVQVLLDEIVCSTVHRCLEPVMMEPSNFSVLNANSVDPDRTLHFASVETLKVAWETWL